MEYILLNFDQIPQFSMQTFYLLKNKKAYLSVDLVCFYSNRNSAEILLYYTWIP